MVDIKTDTATLGLASFVAAAQQKGKLYVSNPTERSPISFHFSEASTCINSDGPDLIAEVKVQRTQPGGFRTLPQFLLGRHNRPEGQVVGIGWRSEQGSKLLFAVLGLPSRNAPFATARVSLGQVIGERAYFIPKNTWKPRELEGDAVLEALLVSINQDNRDAWLAYTIQHSLQLSTHALAALYTGLGIKTRKQYLANNLL